VLRVDNVLPPQITADEEFHRFLFSAAPTTFDDLRARADKGEALAPFTLANVKVTIQIDDTYDVASTELTKNVVGMVEGTDPRLRETYVLFGAHLDHVGYRTSPGGRGGAAPAGTEPDLIFNGADDDGSGSTALLALAKAFATGPKPRRSVVFVWHAAEEAGLLGSRYFADFPPIPLEAVQAQFNIDMIGRNRDDDTGQASTVFIIGADRISTDLHNLVVATNAGLRQPLAIDFEYNDPSDPNSFYTRSDHYSYAVKGIPVAFFFTGTHPDYHGAGDHVDKIIFPKLVRIAQMIYQTGFAVANTDRVLERDNRGPRAGRGFSGPLAK
jgi:Zn-dependent M28 family amino/carboxypeptidase